MNKFPTYISLPHLKKMVSEGYINGCLMIGVICITMFCSNASWGFNCPTGQMVYWYAANAVNEIHTSSDAACSSYDMSQTGYPSFNFVYSQLTNSGSNGAKCFHQSTTAQVTPTPINLINAGIKCEGYVVPDKDDGCTGGNGVGNPCNVATGNKYQVETDFLSNNLKFVRSYNSRNLIDIGLGKGWRNNYQKSLIPSTNSLVLVSGKGRGEPWTKVNNVWQGGADSDYLISQNNDGFQLSKKDGSYEDYNLGGQPLSITDTNGYQTLYSYDLGNNISQMTNHYGQSIVFSYAKGKISTVTDSFSMTYSYEYDVNNNLIEVIYPDATPSDDTDNPRKTYHYENTDYPNHLTGITDENGHRYATYTYDENGKAITTKHSQTTNAVGQERFELDYQGEN